MTTENNNQPGREKEKLDRFSSEPIRLFLLLGAGFFVSWGPGLQKVVPFSLYRLFPLFAGVLVIYWVILGRGRFRAFPLPYNLFFFFALIHTVVCYLIFYPNEFTFQYTRVVYSQENYLLYGGTRGITVVRVFLFMVFAYALSSLLKNRKEFSLFALVYGSGYLCSIILGGHKTVDAIREYTRATGGFLNPNSLGIAGLVCCFLNLSILLSPEKGPRVKTVSAAFILVGIYGMLASVSRNTLVAFSCGGLVVTFYLPLIKKIRWLIALMFLLVAATTLLPGSVFKTISNRVSLESIQESNWSMRRDIWSDYLREGGRYIFTGLGLGRSIEAVRDSYTFDTSRPLIPHQTYLQLLVEFGIIGLVLFLAALWKLVERGIRLSSSSPVGIENAVFFGLLSAFIVYGLVGSILGERTVWLSLGAVAFVQSRLGGNVTRT